MRQAETNAIEVKIVRFGADEQSVSVPMDSTLDAVLGAANIELTASESAWVNGVEADFDSLLDNGDTIQLVGKKEGGR
jgi:hypothetical protein